MRTIVLQLIGQFEIIVQSEARITILTEPFCFSKY